jgi:hypothetical protein
MAVMMLGGAGPAKADPMVFTFEGTGTGDLSGRSFTDAAFTIRVMADTAGVFLQAPGLYVTADSPATIEIAGFGSGAFLTPKTVFDDQIANPVLGLHDARTSPPMPIPALLKR